MSELLTPYCPKRHLRSAGLSLLAAPELLLRSKGDWFTSSLKTHLYRLTFLLEKLTFLHNATHNTRIFLIHVLPPLSVSSPTSHLSLSSPSLYTFSSPSSFSLTIACNKNSSPHERRTRTSVIHHNITHTHQRPHPTAVCVCVFRPLTL